MTTIAQALTVLIADDDDGHALLIQENLEDAGIDNPVRRFRDGTEVWAFLSGEGLPEGEAGRDPDGPYLLLLDIRMPGLDGVEVLRRIKSHPGLTMLPVIMLTTTDDPREVEECYALGCNSYVTKPVNYETFSDVVKRLGLFISVMKVAPPRSSGPVAKG
jgi:CheY-like chemotaxis protein